MPDITTLQDLSSAVLNFTTTINRPFRLGQVIVNFNDGATPPTPVAVTETVTITLVSAKGAVYNSILAKIDLIAESNFSFRPQGDPDFQAGDEIKIECTDSGGVGIAHAIVKASELLK